MALAPLKAGQVWLCRDHSMVWCVLDGQGEQSRGWWVTWWYSDDQEANERMSPISSRLPTGRRNPYRLEPLVVHDTYYFVSGGSARHDLVTLLYENLEWRPVND
jgi:hypothetical protein